MKVITEERLHELLTEAIFNGKDCEIISQLIDNELKEIDTLTVSKLRPMVDAVSDPNKRYKKFLFKRIDREGLDQGQFDTYGNVWINGNAYYPDQLEGWAEFPIYNPEKEMMDMRLKWGSPGSYKLEPFPDDKPEKE